MTRADANSAWAKDRAHVLHPYTDFSTFHDEGSQVITGAEGMYVTDSDGNRLLDGIAGLWCVNIGHGRRGRGQLPELATAAKPAGRAVPAALGEPGWGGARIPGALLRDSAQAAGGPRRNP